jgi:hypothetical protein
MVINTLLIVVTVVIVLIVNANVGQLERQQHNNEINT